MLLALGVAAIVLVALLGVLAAPLFRRSVLPSLRGSIAHVRGPRGQGLAVGAHDPGRELRAEQRARALLRSCVNDEEWGMYSELGFLRVSGALGERPYAYLIYPHRPILAYAPESGVVLGEYCVEFPDHTRPYGSSRLPDSDDVLAKWIALTADEASLIEQANMHLPGRQIELAEAHRDLARLAQWERDWRSSARRTRAVGKHLRARRAGVHVERSEPAAAGAGSVPTL